MIVKTKFSRICGFFFLLNSWLAQATVVECPRVYNNVDSLQLDAQVGTVGITNQRLIDAGCFDLVVKPTLVHRNGRVSVEVPTTPLQAAKELKRMLPEDFQRQMSIVAYKDSYSGIAVMECVDVRPGVGSSSQVGIFYRWARRYWKLDDKRSPLRVWFRESMRPRTSDSEIFEFLLLNFCKAEGK